MLRELQVFISTTEQTRVQTHTCNITLMIQRHENEMTALKTTTCVCVFVSDPDGADGLTAFTLCWNLAHRIINTRQRAGSHRARRTSLPTSKQSFYMLPHASSFSGRRASLASRWEPSLSLLCQTSAGADPRKSICHWMTSNAAAFYIYAATKDLQLRPRVLHLWPTRRRWIVWSKVSIERAWKQRWYQFPPGCWLPPHLHHNASYNVSDVWTEWCFCFSPSEEDSLRSNITQAGQPSGGFPAGRYRWNASAECF